MREREREYLVEHEGFGDCKRPPGLERASDHRAVCARRRAREPEWVLEAQREAARRAHHLHAHVHRVDRRAEARQSRLLRHRAALPEETLLAELRV